MKFLIMKFKTIEDIRKFFNYHSLKVKEIVHEKKGIIRTIIVSNKTHFGWINHFKKMRSPNIKYVLKHECPFWKFWKKAEDIDSEKQWY